jgi:hypothetical protein
MHEPIVGMGESNERDGFDEIIAFICFNRGEAIDVQRA